MYVHQNYFLSTISHESIWYRFPYSDGVKPYLRQGTWQSVNDKAYIHDSLEIFQISTWQEL